MDPAWFFSALMQSTAALVAILGGFFVTRMLSLVGERSALAERIDAIGREMHELNNQLRRKEVGNEAIDPNSATGEQLAAQTAWRDHALLIALGERHAAPPADVAERERLRRDLHDREHRLFALRSRESGLLHPRDLRLAFRALLYLVVPGLVVPAVILAIAPTSIAWWLRGGILVAFLAVLLHLLRLLRALMREMAALRITGWP